MNDKLNGPRFGIIKFIKFVFCIDLFIKIVFFIKRCWMRFGNIVIKKIIYIQNECLINNFLYLYIIN